MITTINASNRDAYKKLYQDAENYLCGYEQVLTYTPNTEYFYKIDEEDNTSFTKETRITSLDTFASCLRERGKLFIFPVNLCKPEISDE